MHGWLAGSMPRSDKISRLEALLDLPDGFFFSENRRSPSSVTLKAELSETLNLIAELSKDQLKIQTQIASLQARLAAMHAKIEREE